MCEYCEKCQALVIGKTDDVGIAIYLNTNKSYYLNAYGYDIHGSGSNGIQVQINYCPMCGRKLESEEKRCRS